MSLSKSQGTTGSVYKGRRQEVRTKERDIKQELAEVKPDTSTNAPLVGTRVKRFKTRKAQVRPVALKPDVLEIKPDETSEVIEPLMDKSDLRPVRRTFGSR